MRSHKTEPKLPFFFRLVESYSHLKFKAIKLPESDVEWRKRRHDLTKQ